MGATKKGITNKHAVLRNICSFTFFLGASKATKCNAKMYTDEKVPLFATSASFYMTRLYKSEKNNPSLYVVLVKLYSFSQIN